MKKLFIAALVLVALTGCSANNNADVNNPFVGEHSVKLEDGRTVVCLSYGGKGMSCDWENARRTRTLLIILIRWGTFFGMSVIKTFCLMLASSPTNWYR